MSMDKESLLAVLDMSKSAKKELGRSLGMMTAMFKNQHIRKAVKILESMELTLKVLIAEEKKDGQKIR